MEVPVSRERQVRTTEASSVTVVLVVLTAGFVTWSVDKQKEID